MFIFLTVTEFGPLPCSIMTTTRKFFTVLASVILFGNVLSGRQWIGTVLVCITGCSQLIFCHLNFNRPFSYLKVFTGLTLDSIFAKKKQQ